MKRPTSVSEDRVFRAVLRGGDDGGALGPIDEVSKRRQLDQIVARSYFTTQSTPPRPGLDRPTVRLAGVAAALTAVVVGGLLLSRLGHRSDPPSPPKQVAVLPTPIEQTPVHSRRFETTSTRAVRSIGDGITLLQEPATVVRVTEQRANRISFALEKGRLWVDVNPKQRAKGAHVMVETSRGEIVVKGTVFGVEETEQYTDVTVLEGAVTVRQRTRGTVVVQADRTLRIGDDTARPLTGAAMKTAWRALLAEGIATERAQRDLGADIDETGQPPTVARPPVVSDEAPHETPARTGRDQAAAPIATPREMLKTARMYQNSRNFEAADRLLGELLSTYPHSEEAPVAAVIQGRLALEKLNRPEVALGLFNQYLREPNHLALRAEALFGKARAEQAVGDDRAACRTLMTFVHAYPDGPLHERAARQLDRLSVNGNGGRVCPK